MASSLRYAALAALVSSVYSYSLGEMPSQTVGVGLPLMELLPTQAPSMELVKKSLREKRAITNTCYEWTLDGLGGTPLCAASATCLFTSASDGFLYEGCGQTSISYDWITACYPYPQTQNGTAPASEIWCPATAPACGYYAFVYDIGQTFWNFGCSRTSFSSTARLLHSSSINALAGAFGVTVTDISSASDPAMTFAPTATDENSSTPTDEGAGSNSNGSTNSSTIKSNSRKKKKTPLGPIIGGVVGGIILITAICVLVWFCVRKNKRSKAANLAQQQSQQIPINHTDGSAYQTQQRYSELGGDGKPQPPPAAYMNPTAATYGQIPGAYGQPVSEKPAGGAYINSSATPNSAPYVQSTQPHGNELGGNNIIMPSPPPTYAQPNQMPAFSAATPPNNYNELPNNGRQSIPPVSPVGTYNTSDISPGGTNTYSPGGTSSHLVTSTPTGNMPSELSSMQPPRPNELGDVQPPQVGQQQAYIANNNTGQSPGPQEVSGTGGIARKPLRQSAGMDMSGNPTSENYPHELA